MSDVGLPSFFHRRCQQESQDALNSAPVFQTGSGLASTSGVAAEEYFIGDRRIGVMLLYRH